MKVTKVPVVPVPVTYVLEVSEDERAQIEEALEYAFENSLWEKIDRQSTSQYAYLASQLRAVAK